MVKPREKLRVLAAADIHGRKEVAEQLSRKAEREKVDLVILAGDLNGQTTARGIIAPFKRRNQTVIFVPGNWDTSAEAAMLKSMYQINDINGYYTTYKGVDIVGVGNPDFQLEHNKKTLERLIKNFEKIKDKKTKKILVSHLHPAGTIAEFSGFEGSPEIRMAIEYFHPDIVISAHIHEAEGIDDKIGKTKIFNVGKLGKVFEI